MDPLMLLVVVVVSIGTGVVATLAVQWYVFNHYIKCLPYVGPPGAPVSGHFRLPQSLIDALQSNDIPKRESCLALNLLFQFLFKELRNAQKVRRWFRHKLSLEFEELLTRTTTGKLFDCVSIRDLCLGTQFPTIKSVSIKDAVLHPQYQHIETLELCLDLEYSGGFQLSIDANMVLGKAAYLSVKVNHLSGQARLQFTRHPYTHWSFSFFGDPVLELQVESQFQGRPLPQITSIIISQIRKSLKKKHTLPNYKLRYKPFFPKSEPGEEVEEATACSPGALQVTVIEVTRLMGNLIEGDIYCSLAVDSTAWVEMVQSETSSFVTLDLTVIKNASQQLGIVFKQEFIVERYQACVLVETVLPQSPASAADVRNGDIVIAVDGKRITSMAQAARIIKGTGDKFTIRVERQLNLRVQSFENVDKDISKDETELGVSSNADGQLSLPGSPVLGHTGLRHRRSSGDKTESDSSSSSPASMPGSPAKRPSLFSRSSHSSPEHKQKTPTLSINKNKDSRGSMDRDDADMTTSENYLQINKTREMPHDQIIVFEESMTFQIHENHRYLNVSVWSKSENGSKPAGRGDRDVLLGHISIPLSSIATECCATKLGHHIKSYFLLPPEPHIAMSRNHKLSGHSGFEPCLCYGDILLSFLYTGQTGGPPSRPTLSPVKPVPPPSPQLLVPKSEYSPESGKKQHDFIRTHFHRTTQCEFCGKKIWLKDAVQCRDCAMTCHKKCVAKCQVDATCSARGAQRRASALPEDGQSRGLELLVPPAQPRRASAQPEIITTAADDGDSTPQGQRRGIGSLLASVASAAQARSLKRVGSANNLAPPTIANSSHLSRSLPPSPQHSPAGSRKASLVGNPFQFPHSLLDSDAVDVTAALDHLLQHPNDDDLMSIAKSTGKELYANLSPPQRKDKINKMISKLKAAIDAETQLRMELAQKEQESKDPSEHTRIAFLIGKSDEKVQALAVLMLHFCAGLQHTQDQEEACKKEADSGSGDDISIESSQ
ncbi:PDZ domain-containing protein 8 isoform X2 [Periplaneta americana]|uniref:PDZ domain-containing protein 8 isoform X2 n=1 Tax=Periplaneta americana TaxID=6978 RepID=UPI0037E879A1